MLNGLLFVGLFALAMSQLALLPPIAHLGISPLIVGILGGTIYGNALREGMPASWQVGVNFTARRLLRLAVAFFGLRVSVQEIAQVGTAGIAMSATVVSLTLLMGWWVGTRLLKLDRETALLTAAGSAICGAAAVLAFESAIGSKPHKSAMAVATVVMFGTLSMFVYPLMAHAGWLHLDVLGLGLYFGGTIHEVAQVVGAASGVNAEVVHIATIVKMTRVIMLVPAVLVVAFLLERSRRKESNPAEGNATRGRLPIPWFALGFLALVCVNSLHVIPVSVSGSLNALDTFALTMAMTALGIETRLGPIRQAGPRVLVAGAILNLWLIVAGYLLTIGIERCFA